MLLGPEDHVTGHSHSGLWDATNAHMNAYQHDDIDLLMSTVSPRGGIWSGILPSQGSLIMRTADEVRANYAKALSAVKIGSVRCSTAVTTDWYLFAEAVTHVTPKATNEPFENRGIGFYGADELGTAMDTDVGTLLETATDADTPTAKLAMYDAHQHRLDALCAGDIDGAVAGLSDTMELFLPCFDPDDERLQLHIGGADDYRKYAEGLLSRYRVDDMKRVNLLTTNQYVFSEVAWSLTDLRSNAPLAVRYALCEVTGEDGLVNGGVGVATRA